MKIDLIKDKIDGIPHMEFSQAKLISEIILENKFQNILELGFKHGVSSCYMAGALDELGGGQITTIDLLNAKELKPNIDQLLEDLELTKFAKIYYEPTSYIWRLMKMLEEDPNPRFDFCYIDGAHDLYVDGFAFFLVDRLLKPGGLIIFDDLNWTFESSPTLKDTEKVKNMPTEEKAAPQIRKVYETLVKKHPSYCDFVDKDGWAFARKVSSDHNTYSGEIKTETVYQKVHVGLGSVALRILKRIFK